MKSSKLPSTNLNAKNAAELEECEVKVNEVDFTRTIDPHEDDTSIVEDEAPENTPDSPFEYLGTGISVNSELEDLNYGVSESEMIQMRHPPLC